MAVTIKAKTPTVEVLRFGAVTDVSVFDKNYLGGKGSNLAEMASMGVPVPPGIIIPCPVSVKYIGAVASNASKLALINGVMAALTDKLGFLVETFGYVPLVSVRSGARVSMPGMMDTILNVGLTSSTLPEWSKRIGERAALDSYRRLIQMLGSVAFNVPMDKFEHCLELVKKRAGVKGDSDLTVNDLTDLVSQYRKVFEDFVGSQFPDSVTAQLRAAVTAVFQSWNNPRAIEYRKIHGYSEDWGTAVVVQSMVFGNQNNESCTGVVFTRCPSTGEKAMTGEFLVNAQGEDVVAGIRTPESISSLWDWNSSVGDALEDVLIKLEDHFRDMQDVEFTVQSGQLFILQTRNGKRAAEAAFKIAHDLALEGRITKTEAVKRVSSPLLIAAKTPKINPKFKTLPDLLGIAAGGGVVQGLAAFSAADAINCTEPCILITKETDPDDIGGMNASVGILTATGGLTSHAAVVARGMNKACVVGATDLHVTDIGAYVGSKKISPGSLVTIDGSTGRVWFGTNVPLIGGTLTNEMAALVSWAAEEVLWAHLRITPLPDVEDWEECIAQIQQFNLPVYLELGLLGNRAKQFLELLRNSEALECDMVLDCSPVVVADSDAVFDLMIGGQGGSVNVSGSVASFLLHGERLTKGQIILKATGLSAEEKKLLAERGVGLSGQVTTFYDLLTIEYPSVSPEVVEKVFGGLHAYNLAVSLVEAHKGSSKKPKGQQNPLYWFEILGE